MNEWMTREQVLASLGIKAQTLYAYVSRKLIEVRPDGSKPNRSLYRAQDVQALVGRRTRSRKPSSIAAGSMSWGEPSIVTGISTVHRGQLIYRGRDAAQLSDAATLESTAALLWDCERDVQFPVPDEVAQDPFMALAGSIASSRAAVGRSMERLCHDAQTAIGTLAGGLGLRPGTQALHIGLARYWGLRPDLEESIRRALVLIADHELNASTFAARVAASTGAPMSASLMAGLCALSGPRHGHATSVLERLIEECAQAGLEKSVLAWLDRHGTLPGFGHPLYPAGDIRARTLLAHVPTDSLMQELAGCAMETTGHLPNIDFALMALARAARLPARAPFKLFLLGRSVGWAAHAIEQNQQHALIRPRARYEGGLGVPQEPG